MDDKTHDGFTNFETWAVAVWIDDDRTNYHYWRDEARRHCSLALEREQVAEGIWTPEQAVRFCLADQLREEFTDNSPVTEPDVYADLLDAALSAVNWEEVAGHILEELEPMKSLAAIPVIYAYSRAQAIADGVLVDVTETAKEAGMKYSTALTAAVWQKYVAVPEGVEAQDEPGRLWDILWMLRCAIMRDQRTDSSRVDFQLLVRNDNHRPEEVTLKALCGPGDDAEPVITIMLPHED